MTDKDKLEKAVKLADAMYYAAQYLTTDASRLHRAMDEYHQFIITEYNKQEPASEDLEQAAIDYDSCRPALYGEDDEGDYVEYIEVRKDAFIAGAQWQKEQIMKDAIEVRINRDRLYNLKPIIHEKYLDYKIGDKVKVIIIKE